MLRIMHTDTVHRAHPISSGERMLVRGHTRIESDLNNARKSRKKKKGLFRAISKTMKKISM